LSKNRLSPAFAVAVFPHLRADDIQSQLHPASLSASGFGIYSHMRMKKRMSLRFFERTFRKVSG
jgi:hypothetical protein